MSFNNSKAVLLGIALFSGMSGMVYAETNDVYLSDKAQENIVTADGFFYSSTGPEILPVYGEIQFDRKSGQAEGTVSSDDGQEFYFTGLMKESGMIEGSDVMGSFIELELN